MGREGNGSSSCHTAKGRGCLPWLSEICWDVERRAYSIVSRVKGGAPEMNCFFLFPGLAGTGNN